MYLLGIPLVVYCDDGSEEEPEAGEQEAGDARPPEGKKRNLEGEAGPSSSKKRRVDTPSSSFFKGLSDAIQTPEPGEEVQQMTPPHSISQTDLWNAVSPAANPPRGQSAFSTESSIPSLPSIESLPSIDDRNEGGETLPPAMSQQGSLPGENEPGENAPQPPGGGEEDAVAPVPTDENVREEIRAYLNNFRQRRQAPVGQINAVADEINLTRASPAKREAILAIMQDIRANPRSITGSGVINSGENARAELTERLDRWVAEHEPTEQ